jgi:putative aldouronate transport system substrate-binding protein
MNISKKLRKNVTFIAFGGLLAAMTACSNGGDGASMEGADNSKPFEISIASPVQGEPPGPDNDIEKRIEEYTNTKLNIQWLAQSASEDKINIMIASGEMPKAMLVDYTPPVISAVRANEFWEIGKYLKDYPQLMKIDDIYYDNIMVDGKRFGLPGVRPIARDAFIYRKDWLKSAGLQEPKSLDELYKLLKAFKEKNTDKFPYVTDKDLNGFDTLVVLDGGANGWEIRDGKMTPAFLTKAYMDVLKFHKKLYDEQLINQDFVVTEKSQVDKLWNAGKVGLYKGVVQNAFSAQDNVKKVVPDAEVDLFAYFDNKKVPGAAQNGGFFLFPKSSVKSEEDLKRILAFFNKISEPTMTNLFEYGIEGKHYKVEDGKATPLDNLQYRKDVKPYRDNINRDRRSAMPTIEPPLLSKGNQMAEDNKKYAVYNDSMSLNSKTYGEVGGELDTLILDATIKYIVGKLDDAGWNKEMDRWKKAGGDKIIEEYTEEFTKYKKK